jgi:hypothetical protein
MEKTKLRNILVGHEFRCTTSGLDYTVMDRFGGMTEVFSHFHQRAFAWPDNAMVINMDIGL